MVYIVTALAIEAAPIIEYFKLKKDMNEHAYPIYKNAGIALIVGGVGKVKCAIAAVYLLSTCRAGNECILLNVGFCGSSTTRYELGSLLLIHKIMDMDTNTDYYPDVLTGQDLPREALCCYSKPVAKEAFNCKTDMFCDMESTGIMETAKKFTYAHQVAILKIISDYMTPTNLNKELLQSYIQKNIPHIEQIINELKQLNDIYSIIPFEKEIQLVNVTSENLRFTEAMKQILLKEVRKARLKGLEPSVVLESLMKIKINSKAEGKKIFEQVIQNLKQRSV